MTQVNEHKRQSAMMGVCLRLPVPFVLRQTAECNDGSSVGYRFHCRRNPISAVECCRSLEPVFNPLMGTLKPHSDGRTNIQQYGDWTLMGGLLPLVQQ